MSAGMVRRSNFVGSPRVPFSRSFAILAALVVVVLTQACAPSMSITRLAPAYFNLGNTKRVAVLQVNGDGYAVAQLVSRLQERIINDGYYQLVVATDRGATFVVNAQGGMIEIGQVRAVIEADVYVNANVTRYVYEVLPIEENKVKRYEPHARVTVNFQVVKNDGRVIVFRDYTGHNTGTKYDEGKTPTRDRDQMLDSAIREAVGSFVYDITPRKVVETIVFDDSDERFKPGIKLAEAGDLAGAERSWVGLVTQDPTLAGAIYNIGVLLETRGDFEQAAAHYNQAIELFGKPLYRQALENMNRRLAESQSLNRGI